MVCTLEVQESIGQILGRLRKELGLTQMQVAGRAGVHRAYYASVERGERNLTLSNLIRITRALKTDCSELFFELDR